MPLRICKYKTHDMAKGVLAYLLGDRLSALEYFELFSIYLNHFPNKPWFLRVCSIKSFENTVGKG